MEKPDVSVIVLIYNSDMRKLFNTLLVVKMQRNVTYEVIIADDHSCTDPSAMVEKMQIYFKFERALFLRGEKNVGTVNNCLNAVEKASGRYVFLTSPGDYLFDRWTLSRFVSFSDKKNARIVFGNAYNYSVRRNKTKITRNNFPPNPRLFYSNDVKEQQIAFLSGGLILGAAYFRERILFLEYLRKVSGICKFIEDTSTTAFCLLDGIGLEYFDSPVVWYEEGTGISSSRETVWKKRMHDDMVSMLEALKLEHSDSRVCALVSDLYKVYGKVIKMFARSMRDIPIIVKVIKNRFIPGRKMRRVHKEIYEKFYSLSEVMDEQYEKMICMAFIKGDENAGN